MTTEEKARRYDLLMVQIRADIADCREKLEYIRKRLYAVRYGALRTNQYSLGKEDSLEYALNTLNKLKELMNES